MTPTHDTIKPTQPTKTHRFFEHPSLALFLIMGLATGILTGLGAPGLFETNTPALTRIDAFNEANPLWLLGWLGWLPLFSLLLFKATPSKKDYFFYQFCAGALAGFFYHLLWMQWLPELYPLDWMGLDPFTGKLVGYLGWLVVSVSGAVLFGLLQLISVLVTTLLDQQPTYKKTASQSALNWSSAISIPLVWVLGFQLMPYSHLWVSLPLPLYGSVHLDTVRRLLPVFNSDGLIYLMLLNAVMMLWVSNSSRLLFANTILKKHLTRVLLCALFPLLLALHSAYAPLTPTTYPSHLPPISVWQGNIAIETIRNPLLIEPKSKTSYLNPLSKDPLPAGALVIMPEEGALPGWMKTQAPAHNDFWTTYKTLAQEKNVSFLSGAIVKDNNQTYNGFVLISPDTPSSFQFYAKQHLVPFGEYTPFVNSEALNQFLNTVMASPMIISSDFNRGTSATPLLVGKSKNIKLGPMICFEALNTQLGFHYKQQGVALLVVTSNLGWFHRNPILAKQYARTLQARAAETGIPLAFSSNTGYSGMVDKHGTPRNVLGNNESGHLLFGL